MSKKIVSILGVLAVTLMLFAACTPAAPAAPAAPAEPAAPPAEPAAPAAPAAADTTSGGEVYYLNFKPEVAELYQKIADEYKLETGVTLKVVTAASGTYEQTLKSEIAKADAPVLFQINGPVGYAAWKDYCADLKTTDLYQHLSDKTMAVTDGDGVYDYLDKCPDTPAGVSVDKDGCPLDTDGDGVYDYLDKCPGTPAGLKVDSNGCPVPVSITLKIEFDTGKSDIKAKYHEEINVVADFMTKYPQTNTVIEGHTDNTGREAANVQLSQSRANSVRSYLIAKFGIEKDRLQAIGYGPKKPIASNATAEGKQKNRRVQAVINTVEKK
jgi:outer membrane protein OmpA-like peptidoglycan-associated protein